MNTIAPKKNNAQKKRGEVKRLIELMTYKDMQTADLAEITQVSKRTIDNTIWNNEEIGGRLLRSLHLKLGVSIDWLLSGVGNMLVEGGVAEQQPGYATQGNEREPIMESYLNYDPKNMQDFWWLTATIAERSLLQAGAVPNTDYTLLDLYKLAQPFVLKEFSDNSLTLAMQN